MFPDVYFVTGTMRGDFGGSIWQFSRNMTVVRDGDDLSLVNSVRLDEDGLAALDRLGRVRNVVRIGSLHGMDDAFYLDRYGATLWSLPGMETDADAAGTKTLSAGGETPFPDCSVFVFEHTKLPECILRLDREGGIMIACDALQNWCTHDRFFSEESKGLMTEMGFFQQANVGPVWMQVNEPAADDFARLKEIPFRHALCGHGEPLVGTAAEDYAATFKRLFDV